MSKDTGQSMFYDIVLMFKVATLNRLHNLVDEQFECRNRGRLSIVPLLGLGIGGSAPDATKVRGFRERVTEVEVVEVLFGRLGGIATAEGCWVKQGQIVYACIVSAPIRCSNPEQNNLIKWSRIAEHRDESEREQKEL